MADPRAFISFDFDNNLNNKTLFVGQIKNSRTPFSAQDWSSKEPLSQATWEQQLKEKIGKCHLMIVLVGESMGSATGVKKEIGFAKDQDVPSFGVYVNGADCEQYSSHRSCPEQNHHVGLGQDRELRRPDDGRR